MLFEKFYIHHQKKSMLLNSPNDWVTSYTILSSKNIHKKKHTHGWIIHNNINDLIGQDEFIK